MQVIFKDENIKNNSRRISVIGVNIYAGRISWYIKGKCIREFESKSIRVWDSGRIFRRNKKRVWRWK